jgi:hypothetical protein
MQIFRVQEKDVGRSDGIPPPHRSGQMLPRKPGDGDTRRKAAAGAGSGAGADVASAGPLLEVESLRRRVEALERELGNAKSPSLLPPLQQHQQQQQPHQQLSSSHHSYPALSSSINTPVQQPLHRGSRHHLSPTARRPPSTFDTASPRRNPRPTNSPAPSAAAAPAAQVLEYHD